jgi:hypothetical protein
VQNFTFHKFLFIFAVFSPASDSESEDEFQFPAGQSQQQFGQQKNSFLPSFFESSADDDLAILLPSSQHSPSASSSISTDSGFVGIDDGKEEEKKVKMGIIKMEKLKAARGVNWN